MLGLTAIGMPGCGGGAPPCNPDAGNLPANIACVCVNGRYCREEPTSETDNDIDTDASDGGTDSAASDGGRDSGISDAAIQSDASGEGGDGG